MIKKCRVYFTSKIVDEHMEENVHFFESIGEIELEDNTVFSLSFVDEKKSETTVQSEITFFFEEDIIMQRTGEVLMEQRFSLGKQTKGMYRTEHGAFVIEADTTKLIFDIDASQGNLEVDYCSYIGGALSGKVALQIKYQVLSDKEGKK